MPLFVNKSTQPNQITLYQWNTYMLKQRWSHGSWPGVDGLSLREVAWDSWGWWCTQSCDSLSTCTSLSLSLSKFFFFFFEDSLCFRLKLFNFFVVPSWKVTLFYIEIMCKYLIIIHSWDSKLQKIILNLK